MTWWPGLPSTPCGCGACAVAAPPSSMRGARQHCSNDKAHRRYQMYSWQCCADRNCANRRSPGDNHCHTRQLNLVLHRRWSRTRQRASFYCQDTPNEKRVLPTAQNRLLALSPVSIIGIAFQLFDVHVWLKPVRPPVVVGRLFRTHIGSEVAEWP